MRAPLSNRGDVRVLTEHAEDVHRLVLPAGGQAVDDVGSGERPAVGPADALADVQAERPAVLAPRIALREPLVLPAAACRRHDHERLVHAAANEARRREPLDVRVEEAHERRIARARRDEAATRLCDGAASVSVRAAELPGEGAPRAPLLRRKPPVPAPEGVIE